MEKRKLLSVLLVMALVVCMMPIATYAVQEVKSENSSLVFTDMPDDCSKTALENAVKNGLLFGYGGKIRPKDNLTRAQMAAMMNRAFGAIKKASLKNYTDVAENEWYYSDMAKALMMRTFVGFDNKLYPNNNITREQAFAVIARAFKLSGASENVLDKFTDKDQVSPWAKGVTASVVAAGYVGGTDGKLNPKRDITRVEIAHIMDNIVKTYIKKAGVYTKDFTGGVMITVPGVTLRNMKITGDLFIGDGVGDGDIILDNVVITGRTVIRGGGMNSIKIIGKSNLQNIIVARVDGQVRVYSEEGLEISEIIVDGNDDVIIEGNAGNVTVTASDITVIATNARIDSGIVEGDNSKIIVSTDSSVNKAEINGDNSEVVVLSGSKIGSIIVNGTGADISGEGKIGKVEAKANGTKVSTPGTKVIATGGAKDVMAGTLPVGVGNSEIVPGRDTTSNSGDDSSSDDSGSSSTITQEAPSGLKAVRPKTSESTDGKITGTTTEMEYKLSTAEDYIKVTGTEITGLAAGTYNVRYAAKEGSKAGEKVDIVILSPTPGKYFTFDSGTIKGYDIAGGKDVIIPAMINDTALTGIGQCAFQDSQLTSVIIPDSVTTIGPAPFLNCTKLMGITVDDTNANYSSLNGILFNKDQTVIWEYLAGKQGEYVIPNTVTSIAIGAFYGCNGLTSVTIPDSVTSISESAFYECKGLTSVSIGNGVKTIDKCAFKGCSELTSVTIGNKVESIGDSAFEGCSKLTGVIIPTSVTSIDEEAFQGCSGLTSVTIPNSVTSISTRAFEGCSGLTSVTISNKITTISSRMFYGCSGLTSVIIPDSVTNISTYAFEGCSELTSVTIGKSVNSINQFVFVNCTKLTQFVVGDSEHYSTIDGVLFNKDKTTLVRYPAGKAGSYVIPDGVKTIANDAFRRNTLLTSVIIPNGVTSIGNDAFNMCTKLTSATIPNGVTINEYGLGFCDKLERVTIGSGVILSDNFINYSAWFKQAYKKGGAGTYALNESEHEWTKTSPLASFTAVTLTQTGDIAHNNVQYGDAAAVKAALPTEIEVTLENNKKVNVPVTWEDTDTYNAASAGDYTFTAVWGDLPIAANNDNNLAAPTVEVTVVAIKTTPVMFFTFVKAEDTITITGYNIAGGKDVVIPATIEGVAVKNIGNRAFSDKYTLTSMIIPDSVTSIESRAFKSCIGLTSLTISDKVTSIGGKAFESCLKLSNVTIMSNVSIGSDAFMSCTALTNATIGDNVTIDLGVFQNCTKLTNVTIGSNVTIADRAFIDEGKTNNFRTAYTAGGAGTYTREGDNWTKK